MINIKLRRGVSVSIAPEEVDLVVANDKYVDVHTNGVTYLHDESIRTLLKRYPDNFIEIWRGVIINPNLIKEIKGTQLLGRSITLTRSISTHPDEIFISRRKYGSVIRKLYKLNKLGPTIPRGSTRLVVNN